MKCKAALLAVLVVCLAAVGAEGHQEVTMSDFVVVPHMKGSLALQTSSITGLWYVPADEENGARLRLLSHALSEAKILGGEEADSVWALFQNRSGSFVFVSHMGGTLAIPRDQIRTAYYSDDSGSPRLRLAYEGDPSGMTIEGDEATEIWSVISN